MGTLRLEQRVLKGLQIRFESIDIFIAVYTTHKTLYTLAN